MAVRGGAPRLHRGPRLAYTVAAVNILAQWHGLELDADGTYHRSIAEFSL